IDKASHYLYTHEKSGNWEVPKKSKKVSSPAQDQPGGQTVTAVFALLSAGEKPDNTKLSAAIKYLQDTNFTSVYTVGMRCQVWRMMMPNDEAKAMLRKDGKALEGAIQPSTGMYNIQLGAAPSTPDNVMSQYGVMGVWACAQEGMEIPTSYWQNVDT